MANRRAEVRPGSYSHKKQPGGYEQIVIAKKSKIKRRQFIGLIRCPGRRLFSVKQESVRVLESVWWIPSPDCSHSNPFSGFQQTFYVVSTPRTWTGVAGRNVRDADNRGNRIHFEMDFHIHRIPNNRHESIVKPIWYFFDTNGLKTSKFELNKYNLQ